MEPHDTDDHEPITLLYWVNKDPAPVITKKANENLRYFKRICGNCRITDNRNMEKEADAIIFRNERLFFYLQVNDSEQL